MEVAASRFWDVDGVESEERFMFCQSWSDICVKVLSGCFGCCGCGFGFWVCFFGLFLAVLRGGTRTGGCLGVITGWTGATGGGLNVTGLMGGGDGGAGVVCWRRTGVTVGGVGAPPIAEDA